MPTDWWITIALLALFLVVGGGIGWSVRWVSHTRARPRTAVGAAPPAREPR